MSDPGYLPGEPAPQPNVEDAPFWEAAAQSRLVLPRCRSCSTFIWYPRQFCPDCHTADVEWVPAGGHGTVYSLTVAERGPREWAAHTPFVMAYVELDEGPRVLTNIVDADPSTVRIGDRVVAAFQPAGATRVLRFRPA